MPGSAKKLISIVVPVYNEEDNVQSLYDRVIPILRGLADRYDYEILFTDNHSTDATAQRLSEMASSDPKVRVIRFSRNFGFQRSIYTAYYNASGDATIQLDCDLQDPPELIPEFIRHWENGYKVVYGVRRTRRENWLINTFRRIFYMLIDLLSEDDLPRQAGDFRLLDRRIIEELRKIYDQQPYLRGAVAALGFDQKGIPYDRAERQRGRSKFSFGELIKLGMDGILNHSIIPLRIASFIGIIVSVITFFGSLGYVLGKFIFGQNWPAGFATITVLILASLSLNALFLGIIGEYLGRIYRQVKRRPLTIIEKSINIDAKIS